MRSLWLVLRCLLAWSLNSSWCVADDYSNNQTIEGAFPQLRHFTFRPQTSLLLNLGGQDLDHCCSIAVYNSLNDDNGNLTLRNLTKTINFDSDLEGFRRRQYPCGARYIGEMRGAPVVKISYGYCNFNCPGWQISKSSVINQWIGPLVGFLVPAVVFCLAIPRRRKVNIPEQLFHVPLNQIRMSFLASITDLYHLASYHNDPSNRLLLA